MAQQTILISASVHGLLQQIDNEFAAREGFSLIVAADVSDLLITARAQIPDVIFVTPYDTYGNEQTICCCKSIKDDPKLSHIPVIAIVEGEKREQIERCQQHKPDDILFTPVNTHLFLASARRSLGLPHRSFIRVQTSLKVEFGLNRHYLRPACAYNLSTGGVFIATEPSVAINSRLIVKLDLPGTNAPIYCESIVSWINASVDPENPEIPSGIGLQFLSLNATDLFAIHNYVNQRENSF